MVWWYGWKGLVRTCVTGLWNLLTLSLFFKWPLKFLSHQHKTITNSLFLRKPTSDDISPLIISTYRFPKLSDQSESVLHLFLVSYWLKTLLFPVSCGGRVRSRLIGRRLVSQLQHSNGEWWNLQLLEWHNNCNTHFPLHLLNLLPQLVTDKCKFEAG